MPNARRLLFWLLAFGALALVFAAYRNPTLMLDLANRVWACI